MSRVLIGIPTYNRPDLVIQAIDSVRRQTFDDLTVIVSDNRSEQAAAAQVEAYVASLDDPRFSFVSQPINGGEYGQGWYFYDQAQAFDYLIILHDDDLLEPHFVAGAVGVLDAQDAADVFVADPTIIDGEGAASATATADYLRSHGRTGAAQGAYDIGVRHILQGFTPVSGTAFRVSTLRRSGFVDEDCHGNFPFEFNLFLRLGDIGATGWFCKEPLLRVRFHAKSLRQSGILDDPHVVDCMLRLLQRRRYSGIVEQRRRTLVASLLRAEALIRLRSGDLVGCRQSLVFALAERAGPTTLAVAALAWTCPPLLVAILPRLPQRQAPPPPVVRPLSSFAVPARVL